MSDTTTTLLSEEVCLCQTIDDSPRAKGQSGEKSKKQKGVALKHKTGEIQGTILRYDQFKFRGSLITASQETLHVIALLTVNDVTAPATTISRQKLKKLLLCLIPITLAFISPPCPGLLQPARKWLTLLNLLHNQLWYRPKRLWISSL